MEACIGVCTSGRGQGEGGTLPNWEILYGHGVAAKEILASHACSAAMVQSIFKVGLLCTHG